MAAGPVGRGRRRRDRPAAAEPAGVDVVLPLWLAQVVSSLGDWIGLVAVLSITARVGGSSPEAAIALVMSARMIPGFFLASLGGVLVDRWDRKKVMVTCDIGRGLTLATLPFVRSVWGLFLVSLVLELFTLLWSPAKEASVPNVVKVDKLPAANSFSLAAAYGTFPLGSALFASLTKVSEWLGRDSGPLDFLELNQETLAIYVDVLTFLTLGPDHLQPHPDPDESPPAPVGPPPHRHLHRGQGGLAVHRHQPHRAVGDGRAWAPA